MEDYKIILFALGKFSENLEKIFFAFERDEKIKYSCNQCGHQATQQGNLTRHIQSIHAKI